MASSPDPVGAKAVLASVVSRSEMLTEIVAPLSDDHQRTSLPDKRWAAYVPHACLACWLNPLPARRQHGRPDRGLLPCQAFAAAARTADPATVCTRVDARSAQASHDESRPYSRSAGIWLCSSAFRVGLRMPLEAPQNRRAQTFVARPHGRNGKVRKIDRRVPGIEGVRVSGHFCAAHRSNNVCKDVRFPLIEGACGASVG